MKFILLRKRSLLFLSILFIILALAVTGTKLAGSASIWSGGTVINQPINFVDTDSGNVALTFDAGLQPKQASQILKVLQEGDITATYFVAGYLAEANSDTLRQLAASERLEFGTLGNSLIDLAKLNKSQINLELQTSVSIIESITNKTVQLFRAPNKYTSNKVLDIAKNQGLYTVGYSVNSLDYNGLSASDIANKVVSGTKSGSIIFMHSDGEQTLNALPAIIEGIKNKGLNFVTVSQLIYKQNYIIDSKGKQIRSN